jgi:hypothetical protein
MVQYRLGVSSAPGPPSPCRPEALGDRSPPVGRIRHPRPLALLIQPSTEKPMAWHAPMPVSCSCTRRRSPALVGLMKEGEPNKQEMQGTDTSAAGRAWCRDGGHGDRQRGASRRRQWTTCRQARARELTCPGDDQVSGSPGPARRCIWLTAPASIRPRCCSHTVSAPRVRGCPLPCLSRHVSSAAVFFSLDFYLASNVWLLIRNIKYKLIIKLIV